MSAEPRRSLALLGAWAAAVFALSTVKDPWLLAVLLAAALGLLRRGAGRALRRLLAGLLPAAVGLAGASYAWLAWIGPRPAAAPFVALVLRSALIAFLTLSVIARADLLRAAAPFPVLSRLLALCLAQIHALRLLVTESAEGLRSRLPGRPRTRDVVHGSGAVTVALLSLSARNAREVGEAMRSRGFH